MKNLNLASLFNLIILFLGVLVVSLILFTLLKLNLIFKIILSAALAVIVLYFAYRRESRYYLQTKADVAAKGRLNEGMHILNTCALDEILPIFLEFFSQSNICAKAHKRYLLVRCKAAERCLHTLFVCAVAHRCNKNECEYDGHRCSNVFAQVAVLYHNLPILAVAQQRESKGFKTKIGGVVYAVAVNVER